MPNTFQRELRVAFSKRVQPVWLRVAKWTVFLGVSVVLSGSGFFWYWVAGLPLAATLLHFSYRWRTGGWKRPWGGWNDVDAGR